MTVEPKSPTVWPLWGRVLFASLFVLVLVLVGAGIAAASGGFQMTPSAIRVYVAAVLIPGLLVLAVSAVSVWRASRLRSRLDTALRDLVAAADDRSGIDDPVARVADRARSALAERDTREALEAVDQLEQLAAHRPDLAARCADTVRTAHRLRRALDTAERQRR